MSDAFWIAVVIGILALPGTFIPLLTLMITNSNRRQELAVAITRQDKVAKDLKEEQEKVAKKVEEVALAREANAEKVDKQLKGITTMVDGKFTKALENELEGREFALVQTLEFMLFRKEHGQEPTPGELAAVDTMKGAIARLKVDLATRAESMAKVEQAGHIVP